MDTFQFLFIVLKRLKHTYIQMYICFSTSRVLSPQNKISPYSGRVQKFSAPYMRTNRTYGKASLTKYSDLVEKAVWNVRSFGQKIFGLGKGGQP